jgi:hypothetical protein
MQPFHMAFPTSDLAATRAFFVDVLGVGVGRECDKWVDFDFFGHQITAHLDASAKQASTNPVDGKKVPTFHFGVVLDWTNWETLAERLRSKGVEFVIEPYVRFKGEVGEQGTFFLYEPAGAALEFKSFKDMSQLFAR